MQELNRVVLLQNGNFRMERYWLSGWVKISSETASVKFIWGYTGKETEVTETKITPSYTFEVKETDK